MDQGEIRKTFAAFEERQRRIRECIDGACRHWAGRPRRLSFPEGVRAIAFDAAWWNAAVRADDTTYMALLEMGEVDGRSPEEIAAFADAHGVKWRYVRPYKGRPRKSDGDLYAWHNE